MQEPRIGGKARVDGPFVSEFEALRRGGLWPWRRAKRPRPTSLMARGLASLGRRLQALRALRLAAIAFRVALLCDSRPAEWHYQLGLTRERLGRWRGAVAAYEAAAARDETLTWANDAITRIGRLVYAEAKRQAPAVLHHAPRLRVSFLPAPTAKNLASARIRCAAVASALNDYFAGAIAACVGEDAKADVTVVSQTCSATMLLALAEAKGGGTRIVYDCCDPYAEQEGKVYGIPVARRFWDLIALADAITVPTEAMQLRLRNLRLDRPTVIVPDGIDYADEMQRDLVPSTRSAVWFGNPGRGNLESGLWALEALKDRFGYAVTLITDPAKALVRSDFIVEPWSYPGFVSRLRGHGLVLISQDAEATYKSENRYIVSLMNGVPAISTGSASVAKLLEQSGFAEMSVADERQLDRALELLGDPGFRADYVSRMQQILLERFGAQAVAQAFVEDVLRNALGLSLAHISDAET